MADAKKIKIAIIASSTVKSLEKTLAVKVRDLGLTPEIYLGPYGQASQEILEKKSDLYAFQPDLTIVFIDTRALLGDRFFDYHQLSAGEKNKLFENILGQLKLLADKLKRGLQAKIILHNFEVPFTSPFGIIDNKQKLGLGEFVKKLNLEIENLFRRDPQIFIFDYEAFCAKWGKSNVFDHKLYYFGDFQISFAYLPKLAEEYISYIKPLAALTKKCLVLDLDNTLWGGVVGEDGLAGLKLGPTPEGRPFWEFQKHLLSLFHRGVILAINSKNNPKDAWDALNRHPHMVLKEQHFASVQINWRDKVSNLKAIAKELNIGLDSLVFIDDDKLNREVVKNELPEVTVVDLPEDPALYPKTLLELNHFNSFYFSAEDKKKGQMYAEQRQRLKLNQETGDVTEYLKALEMTVTVAKATSFSIPRLAQLTQKTNQFNMTTRRYTEEDIVRLAKDKSFLVLGVGVEDKFGDNGLSGVVIVEKKPQAWRLETFLLSCRVIGRRVEEAVLAYVARRAKKAGAKKLIGEFISTAKNAPAKNFYQSQGFRLDKEEGGEIWSRTLARKFAGPGFIKIIEAKNRK